MLGAPDASSCRSGCTSQWNDQQLFPTISSSPYMYRGSLDPVQIYDRFDADSPDPHDTSKFLRTKINSIRCRLQLRQFRRVPVFSPAKNPAPNALSSESRARSTFNFVKSAKSWQMKSFFETPPSTLQKGKQSNSNVHSHVCFALTE